MKFPLKKPLLVYHGTNTKSGLGQKSGFYPGTYTSKSKEVAQGFGENVETLQVDSSKIFPLADADELKRKAAKAGFGFHGANGRSEANYLKSHGYIGMARGNEVILFPFKKQSVRSYIAKNLSAKLRLRELARIPRLKLSDDELFVDGKWEAAHKAWKGQMAKFVAENPKGGLLVGRPVIHSAETRWDVSYPKIKKTGVTLISPDIETPGKWRTTHFLRQKVLGKNQAGFLDKSDYAKGALVPHSHNTHDTLADAYDDARATRGSTARFTKKNIFSAKLRLRELAGKFTTENTENTEGRK